MRNRVLSVGVAVIAIGAMMALSNCQNTNTDQSNAGGNQVAQQSQTLDSAGMVARGKYLVIAGGCNDCHSPKNMTAQGPMPDPARMLSGQPAGAPKLDFPKDFNPQAWMTATDANMTQWAGPWGISYAANLTPDTATGIGSWTADVFVSTIKSGKHMGTGRDIIPPMPWQAMSMLTDEDLRAIFSFLRTIPPVSNQVPQPTPPPGAGAAPQEGGK